MLGSGGMGVVYKAEDTRLGRDGKIEPVVSLKDFYMTGYYGNWFGLAPDNSPLLLKGTGTEDIVSMDWNAP